jgi:hypothetical protein
MALLPGGSIRDDSADAVATSHQFEPFVDAVEWQHVIDLG